MGVGLNISALEQSVKPRSVVFFLKGAFPRPAAGPAQCFPVGVSCRQWHEDTLMLSYPYKLRVGLTWQVSLSPVPKVLKCACLVWEWVLLVPLPLGSC